MSHAVLGGRRLHDQYYVVSISAADVREVADALGDVDRTWLRRRFDAIDDPDLLRSTRRRRLRVHLGNFVEVQAFYRRAAAAQRAVVFTAT